MVLVIVRVCSVVARRVARIFCGGGGGVSQEPGPNNERFE